MKNIINTAIVLLFYIISLSAGWNIKMDGGQKYHLYFEKNKLALVDNKTHIIVDGNKQTICFVNHNHRIYWEGTVNELIAMMSEGIKTAKENIYSQMKTMDIPPEQKKMLDEMLKGMGYDNFDERDITVQISFDASTELNNYHCDIYSVTVNGKKTETIYLSKELPFYTDLQNSNAFSLLNEMQGGMMSVTDITPFRSSAEYLALMKKGFPVLIKTLSPSNISGNEEWSSVKFVSSAREDVRKYLYISSDYKKTDLNEIMQQMIH